ALIPPNMTFAGSLALSPDGRQLAFCSAGEEGTSSLWIRALDSVAPRPLPGTEGATLPFWSPDSRSVGFFAAGKLKTMDVSGSVPPQVVVPQISGDPRGGAWAPDGTLVLARDFHGHRR